MKKENFVKYILAAGICFLIHSCANLGVGPQGGPRDTTPPTVVKSTPADNETNYNKKKIEIEFNEIILLDRIGENLVISPPQKTAPDIQALGKKVSVTLKDDLQENTTYTVNFGNAVIDNKEKNAIKNFSLAFSTGDVIDTLVISGYVIQAKNLERAIGTTVGIYDVYDDSVFRKQPPLRIAKTDSTGYFTIKNIKDGAYQLFALNDLNRDFTFDQPGEAIAFLDSLVKPYIPVRQIEIAADSALTDSLTADSIPLQTIHTKPKNENDLILYLFEEDFSQQYFVKRERPQRNKFMLFFAEKSDVLPELKPLNFENENFYLLEKSSGLDTLTYWITDSLVAKMDTMQIAMSYLKTDTLYQLVPQTDTLLITFKDQALNNQARRRQERRMNETTKTSFVNAKTNIRNSTVEIYDDIQLSFSEPIIQLSEANIHLRLQETDTVWIEQPFSIEPDSLNTGLFYISYEWEGGNQYQLEIDSGASISFYGLTNNKFKSEFKIPKLEDYSNFFLNIENAPRNIFVELLNAKDEVVRKEFLYRGSAGFEYLKPGTYFVRIIIDENWNGFWNTGNYRDKKQPEKVYYFEKQISLRKNWDQEETWDYLKLPILEQKPREIKPVEKKR